MKVIGHRGLWRTPAEKNSVAAFEACFAAGFGTETDVRDCAGRLLVSHDMATGTELPVSDLLRMAARGAVGAPLTLALNVKADGLARALRRELDAVPGLDCFVFDMSIPDTRAWFPEQVPVFVRMSEVEQAPAWLDRAQGVWLDGFESEWYPDETLRTLLRQGKRVCVVSPELHRRDHGPLWSRLRAFRSEPQLLLCTDFPHEATAALRVETAP